ncbi:hypothetical protein BEI60_26215 [Eisenbergiella tayi]|nr:hypothetical protein [Eisenbergiella tayi]ODR33134.1 hypothetical protein BEI60_26215 [Eisenbergiella tayi]
MSRSKAWKTEWAFFLGENGRRQYNRICKRYVHDCKQSFRADLIECPRYIGKEAKKTPKRVEYG